jgi:hypothetical protein
MLRPFVALADTATALKGAAAVLAPLAAVISWPSTPRSTPIMKTIAVVHLCMAPSRVELVDDPARHEARKAMVNARAKERGDKKEATGKMQNPSPLKLYSQSQSNDHVTS